MAPRAARGFVVRLIRLGVIVAALVGCGDPTAALRGTVELAPIETARFGSLDSPGAILTSVVGVVPTESAIFVLESDPPRVAVFDPSGTWMRDISRRGDGPGELQSPDRLGWQEESVWVADARGGRLEVFHPDGDLERSVRWSVPADDRGTTSVPYALLRDGSYIAGPAGLPIGAVFTGAVDHRMYLQVEEDEVSTRPLYTEDIVVADFVSAEVAGRQAVIVHPHPQAPIVRPLADGAGLLVVERSVAAEAQSDSFFVRSIAVDGEVRVWSVVYSPVPAEGWRDRHRTEMVDWLQARSESVDRSLLGALVESPADIRFLPPVSEAVPGSDGSVWVRREDDGGDLLRWNAFSADGQSIGRVDLPRNWTVLRASASELWVVEPDDLDVPFVVRYRLAPRQRADEGTR